MSRMTATQFQRETERLLSQISRLELLDPAGKAERRARSKTDRLFFLKTYLPHYFTHEFSKSHIEALDFIDNLQGIPGLQLWPRDWGKTSLITIGDSLWKGLEEISRFTLIGGDTEDVATQKSFLIKLELENNPRIIQDYGIQKGLRKWEDADFVTRGGWCVRALGQKSTWRGHNFLGRRPDRAVLDDLEDNENVENPRRVQKRLQWIRTEVFGALDKDKFELVILGNLFSRRGALARIVANKDGDYKFKVFKISAEDKNGNSTWPERYTKADLEKRRGIMGSVAYAAEMMHKPSDEGVKVLEAWINRCNPDELPSRDAMTVVAFLDPSAGSKNANDFKAFVVCGYEKESTRRYVLDSFVKHYTPEVMLDQVHAYDELYSPVVIGMEENALKEFLSEAVRASEVRNGKFLPWKAVHHSLPKDLRIERLVPAIERGEWTFVRRGDNEELIDQWLFYGSPGMKDDGPDAHAGCDELVARVGSRYFGFHVNEPNTFHPVGSER